MFRLDDNEEVGASVAPPDENTGTVGSVEGCAGVVAVVPDLDVMKRQYTSLLHRLSKAVKHDVGDENQELHTKVIKAVQVDIA